MMEWSALGNAALLALVLVMWWAVTSDEDLNNNGRVPTAAKVSGIFCITLVYLSTIYIKYIL